MATDWKLCVDWLVRSGVLQREHRVAGSGAKAQDLANLLKDGVRICHLLNQLNQDSIDPKEFSQRPQMSQFLCQKNIHVFLHKCKSVFHMKDEDLFQVSDLMNLDDFGKVLHTLSALSQTPLAQKSKITPFALSGDRNGSVGKLTSDIDANEEDDDRYMRASVYDHSDKIYDQIFNRSFKQDTPTKTRRDYCIEEIVETEKKYVEALEMINTVFLKPLKESKNLMSPYEHEKIFLGNERLQQIHREFLASLLKASDQQNKSELNITIPDCFVMSKERFLFYGEFCSNLTHGQELLARLCKSNPALQQKITECQRTANAGKFRLHDLLAIPVQRILKYHLLISELMKNTDERHPERRSLEKALEEMQDLSLFVNEMRRDHEILNSIALFQSSIFDMPVNVVLKEFGRMHMDGELKYRLVSENTLHSRHIFLFDKRLLICKPTRAETYVFKSAPHLYSCKLNENIVKEKGLFGFQLDDKLTGDSHVIFAKKMELRDRWRDGILLAQDNVSPPYAHNQKHDFILTSFDRTTICDVCRKLLRGVFFQGYKCQKTKMVAHKECLEKARDMDGPPTAIPQRPNFRERYEAIAPYTGTPSPPVGRSALTIKVGDLIDLINSDDPNWIKGELDGKRGFVPRTSVKKSTMLSRKVSCEPQANTDPKVNIRRTTSLAINSARGSYVNTGCFGASNDDDIDAKSWFMGSLSREEANDKLETLPNGTFLVRESSASDRKGEYAISIKFDDTVKHMKIGKDDGGQFYLVNVKTFPSITALVQYHQLESLEKLFPEVQTVLAMPYKEAIALKKTDVIGYCIAKFDYSATAENHISLKRGDRVAIISKSGEGRGWWKGSNNGKIGFFPNAYVKESS